MGKKLWDNAIDMPPVWLVFFIALVWGQTAIWNPLSYAAPLSVTVGRTIVGIGLILIVVAALMFWRQKTSVIPKQTPKSMISGGLYRLSRNPIYLADAIILFGVCISNGSVIGLALVPIFMGIITSRFILGEEAGLRREFGAYFETYCTQTRRWI